MVSKKSIEKQLKKIKFNYHAWGRAEANELSGIILPDEKIYEAVNGMYDGGFALLVATDVRLLLVDKKPLNFLTVEDMRFEMINEIDYSHRLMGARISISAGSKNLKFMSLNQQRLRKTIGHVQHCMAESKKKQSDHQEDQKQHLQQINQQLQTYLLAQHQQQQKLQEQLEKSKSGAATQDGAETPIEVIKPDPQLADFLFAQSLMQQHNLDQLGQPSAAETTPAASAIEATATPATLPANKPELALPPQGQGNPVSTQMADLYAEGMREIFGRKPQAAASQSQPAPAANSQSDNLSSQPQKPLPAQSWYNSFDVNPLKIAYSKLPMALRNRKFGRPSFHAHSQTPITPTRTAES